MQIETLDAKSVFLSELVSGKINKFPIGTGEAPMHLNHPFERPHLYRALVVHHRVNEAGCAHEAGGRTVVVTARPAQASQMPVDILIHLPAQTMADVAAGSSILTMGTHYEAALLLFGDFLVLRLLELTNQKREDMYTRYTNMK